jgi:hypothetical protein
LIIAKESTYSFNNIQVEKIDACLSKGYMMMMRIVINDRQNTGVVITSNRIQSGSWRGSLSCVQDADSKLAAF